LVAEGNTAAHRTLRRYITELRRLHPNEF
jgi:hypothetical protein